MMTAKGIDAVHRLEGAGMRRRVCGEEHFRRGPLFAATRPSLGAKNKGELSFENVKL